MDPDPAAYTQALRIVVVSMYAGKHALFRNLTLPINHAYCEQHGYAHVELDEASARAYVAVHVTADGVSGPWKDQELPTHFSKLPGIAAAFDATSADWAYWQDADAFFLNHNFRIVDLVDPRYHMIVPAYLHSNRSRFQGMVNTGNFLVRNSPQGRDLLRRLYNIGLERKHMPHYAAQVRKQTHKRRTEGGRRGDTGKRESRGERRGRWTTGNAVARVRHAHVLFLGPNLPTFAGPSLLTFIPP